jgi:hypothetical protein
MAVATKKFSEKSLNPVTNHRFSHLCTNRHPESVFSFIVRFADNDKMGGVNSLSPS